MWGCMDESIISISAALHAAMACNATKYIDLDGSFDLAKDLVERYHSKEKAKLAEAAFDQIFIKKDNPEKMPSHKISSDATDTLACAWLNDG